MTIGVHPCARALPYVATPPPAPPLPHTLHTSEMFECEEMDKMIG